MLGDQVLVQDPVSKITGLEKIILVYNHAHDKQAHSSLSPAIKLTIVLEDGQSTVCHTLASSHFMLTKRGCDAEDSFVQRRADETLVGDFVLTCNIVNDGPACLG